MSSNRVLSHSRIFRLLIGLALVLAGVQIPAFADSDYMTCVASALQALETGRTDVALSQLKVALKWDANDALAHAALGVTLLMGGRPKEASQEFSEVAALAPRRPEGAFGQGLVRLSEGRVTAAGELFAKAQSLSVRPQISEATRYVSTLAGKPGQPMSSEVPSEASRAMDAFALMGAGRHQESAELWRDLQSAGYTPGYGDRPGFGLTLLPSRPLVVSGQGLRGKVDLPSRKSLKGPVLSGTVSLRADLSKVKEVSMVAFFVDNKLAGLTNRPPYQYMWNTARVANGQHTVRIVGSDSAGCTVSEKMTVVQVLNHTTDAKSDDGESTAQSGHWDRLWDLMRLKPSAAAVSYHLGACHQALGDVGQARSAFMRVLAVDANYKDAAHRLAIIRPNGESGRAVHRVMTDAKAVALTFDDGPTPDTPRLLALLKDKGVKATFFVVGKRAEMNPEVVREMAQIGHEIANHTYGHRALDLISATEIMQEIFKGAVAIESATGKTTMLLRPPGGRSGRLLEEVANRFGITNVFWTANCTSREGGSWEKMRDYIIASAAPGSIVLMHNAEGVTLRALPEAIDALREHGYSFVTLSELLSTTTAQ